MIQVGIREAQVNITKLLNQLPFEITRFGKVVARVVAPNDVLSISKPVVLEKKEKLKPVTKSGYCKHGVMLGLGHCRFGCTE